MTEEQSLVFSRGQLLLATNYGLALSLPLSHTPTTGKGSFSQMNAAIAEHGSGKALAVHLGNTSSNPARWISDHRRRIKKALES